MPSIDYYFSVLSPFTYLASLRLETIAARHGAGIHYTPMDLAQVFPQTGGVMPKDRHWSRQEYRAQELRRIADHNKMNLNLKPAHWPTDPLPASCAIIAAQRAGLNCGPLAHAFTRAVWSEERDIADPATVDAIVKDSGIDPEALATTRDGAEGEFNSNTEAAVANGVFGAPFYIVGSERFWGQDRLEYLDRHLQGLED